MRVRCLDGLKAIFIVANHNGVGLSCGRGICTLTRFATGRFCSSCYKIYATLAYQLLAQLKETV